MIYLDSSLTGSKLLVEDSCLPVFNKNAHLWRDMVFIVCSDLQAASTLIFTSTRARSMQCSPLSWHDNQDEPCLIETYRLWTTEKPQPKKGTTLRRRPNFQMFKKPRIAQSRAQPNKDGEIILHGANNLYLPCQSTCACWISLQIHES